MSPSESDQKGLTEVVSLVDSSNPVKVLNQDWESLRPFGDGTGRVEKYAKGPNPTESSIRERINPTVQGFCTLYTLCIDVDVSSIHVDGCRPRTSDQTVTSVYFESWLNFVFIWYFLPRFPILFVNRGEVVLYLHCRLLELIQNLRHDVFSFTVGVAPGPRGYLPVRWCDGPRGGTRRLGV